MVVNQPASKNQTSSWFHLEFCCRLTRNYANINEKHVWQEFICWTLNFGANSLPLDSETCNSSAPSETTDLWSVFRLCPVESSLLTPQTHRNADQSFLWIRWERDFFRIPQWQRKPSSLTFLTSWIVLGHRADLFDWQVLPPCRVTEVLIYHLSIRPLSVRWLNQWWWAICSLQWTSVSAFNESFQVTICGSRSLFHLHLNLLLTTKCSHSFIFHQCHWEHWWNGGTKTMLVGYLILLLPCNHFLLQYSNLSS